MQSNGDESQPFMLLVFDEKRQNVKWRLVVANPAARASAVGLSGIAIGPIARREINVTRGCTWKQKINSSWQLEWT